jgi:putative transposase
MDKISDNEKHRRRSIRLKNYDYSQAGAYFVTVCTHNREYLFGKITNGKMQLNKTGKMIKLVWDELPKNYTGVNTDIFVVMLNHIHGIIVLNPVGAGPRACPEGGQPRGVAPTKTTMILPDVVHRLKSLTTDRYWQLQHSFSKSKKLWQRNYYEHVVRNENELNLIRQYILYNPLQWQYDRENPESVPDDNYKIQWGDFEEMLYEKKLRDRQDACQTNTKQVSQTFLSDNYRTGKMPVPPN